MFVRPRRISTRSVNDTKDRVGAHKIPGEDRIAILIGWQPLRVYGCPSAIRAARTDAIEESLIVFNSFFILRPSTDWRGTDRARPAGEHLAGLNLRLMVLTVISDSINNSYGARRSTTHDSR